MLERADRTAHIQRPIFSHGNKAIFQSDYSSIHAMVTLLYRKLQTTL